MKRTIKPLAIEGDSAREPSVLPGEVGPPRPPAPVDSTTATQRPPATHIGGSRSDAFNFMVLQDAAAVRTIARGLESHSATIESTMAAMVAFKPADEIEGTLAAQAVALHYSAVECLRRAAFCDQPAEIAGKLRKDGANLARAMTDMLDALDRKRGKGPQVIRLERVVVHEGGQANVGNVQSKSGGTG